MEMAEPPWNDNLANAQFSTCVSRGVIYYDEAHSRWALLLLDQGIKTLLGRYNKNFLLSEVGLLITQWMFPRYDNNEQYLHVLFGFPI